METARHPKVFVAFQMDSDKRKFSDMQFSFVLAFRPGEIVHPNGVSEVTRG